MWINFSGGTKERSLLASDTETWAAIHAITLRNPASLDQSLPSVQKKPLNNKTMQHISEVILLICLFNIFCCYVKVEHCIVDVF